MSRQIFLLAVLIISGFSLFGQLASSEISLFDYSSSEIFQSDLSLETDIGEIEEYNFRKRRFANWAFFTEFGGVVAENTFPHFSANLEGIIESKEKHMFTGRFGAGIIMRDGGVDIFIPGYLTFLFGYKNHFEVGAGANFLMSSDQSSQIVPAGIIGFRHQNPRGGVIYGFNLNLTLPQREITANTTDYILEPWLSARLGYCW